MDMSALTYWVCLWEQKSQTIHLIIVDRIVIQNSQVECPLFEAVPLNEFDAWWQAGFLNLYIKSVSKKRVGQAGQGDG